METPSRSSIRELRLAKGLTQAALAQLSGLPQTTISRIERGAMPLGDTLQRLAKALGVDADTITLTRAREAA